jgi:ADP-heptose:LPS heptosyltransferase
VNKESMKLSTEEIKKIAVFRALQLGDMLCSIPAIRALRNAFPNAEITLIGLPWAKLLLQRFPGYFNSFIIFPGYPGFPEQEPKVEEFPSFITQTQNKRFDLALQMQGNGMLSNPLVKLFGAKHTTGFYKEGNYCPDPNLYLTYPDDGAEVERHLQLMQHLGIEPVGTQLEFPLTEEDEAQLAELQFPLQPKNYICIHPGARGADRRWKPENFAALGDYCISKDVPVVITGTPDEMEIVESVTRLMKQKPMVAAGKTSLGAVGVLIKNARGLISNCTGVSHMASAFKTNSIVISMDGEPDRWGPLNRQVHHVIDWAKEQDYNKVLKETEALISNRS